jgi:hypothetical protein
MMRVYMFIQKRSLGIAFVGALLAMGAVVSGASGQTTCDTTPHPGKLPPEILQATILVEIDGICYRENLRDICWVVACPRENKDDEP